MNERQCSRVLVYSKVSGEGPRQRRYPVSGDRPAPQRITVMRALYQLTADVWDYRPDRPVSAPTEATKR